MNGFVYVSAVSAFQDYSGAGCYGYFFLKLAETPFSVDLAVEYDGAPDALREFYRTRLIASVEDHFYVFPCVAVGVIFKRI